MKVCFFTLGCKVNQQETAAMINIFKNNGWELAEDKEKADAYIVNSCTVTLSGDKKSIQWIRRAKRQSPDAVVVLCGCMPQAFPEKATEVCEADIIIGSKGKASVYELVCQFLMDKKRFVNIVPHSADDSFEDFSSGEDKQHTRAFLKVQDGCNRRCAYCIIPSARGSVRSRSVQSIVEEATRASELGHKEIVLTGVNISCYGQDLSLDICDVIDAVANIPTVYQIRFGSLELDLFTDEMLVRMSKVKKLCPHFHLSLQSGCDKTLKNMNRLYDTKLYTGMMARLRELFVMPTFTTDIIVGFPQETQSDFLQSVAFVQNCEFLRVHTFSFSAREGTLAYTMTGQVDNATKQERNRIMSFKSETTKQKLFQSFIGFEDCALLEQKNKDGFFAAYTTRYIPVLIKADENMKTGDIINVCLKGIEGQKMSCERIENSL